jgi:NADPH:quinone reductase-like Zn-dependent oxidoreductase
LFRYFPDGIDINFENVGGEMLEAVLANMNTYGRVALSGVIFEYTGSGRRAVPDLREVIYKRVTVRGFSARDFCPGSPSSMPSSAAGSGTGRSRCSRRASRRRSPRCSADRTLAEKLVELA